MDPSVLLRRTNLRNELAKLVKVGLIVGVDAQFADGLGKFFRTFKGVHLVILIFHVLEITNVAQQLRLDVVVEKKLRECEEALGQKLERKVDCGVHDA